MLTSMLYCLIHMGMPNITLDTCLEILAVMNRRLPELLLEKRMIQMVTCHLMNLGILEIKQYIKLSWIIEKR